MIRYSLICQESHAFESWFRDSAAFDALAAANAVTCPTCGAGTVRKALMRPSVVTRRAKAPAEAKPAAPAPTAAEPAPAPAEQQPVALMDEKVQHLRAMIRDFHKRMTDNADDVGRAFASEARAIHEGAAPARSIYGEATRDEVSALIDEGVPLLPMPVLPDDRH